MAHLLISNIPAQYRSAKLRKYFVEFVEKGAFECFHFRHRPEKRQEGVDEGRDDANNVKVDTSCCCVVKVKIELVSDFINTYHGKRWGEKMDVLGCSMVLAIQCDDSLSKLPELHPPNVMPRGNVGTPTTVFLEMINNCILPPAIIKKLDLTFPRLVKRKQYSAVPPNNLYQPVNTSREETRRNSSIKGKKEQRVRSEEKDCNVGESSSFDPHERKEERGIEEEFDQSQRDLKDDIEEDGEDWDRYCTLHNDIDTQARTKERLFENDLEVVWDKGSSGLVFYTDGNYWEEIEGKDTDELWTDDWDVDMGVYEGQFGDKDSQDLLSMRKSKRNKKHGNLEREEDIGDFEKYTNGFGSRIMKRQGWTTGDSIGKSEHGLKEPLPTEGQPAWKKTGFGYHGEMIERMLQRKHEKTKRPPEIGSKFDELVDEKDSLYRSHDENTMKYRR